MSSGGLKVMHELEALRSQAWYAGQKIINQCSRDCEGHANELFDFSNKIQMWIDNIRDGK